MKKQLKQINQLFVLELMREVDGVVGGCLLCGCEFVGDHGQSSRRQRLGQ